MDKQKLLTLLHSIGDKQLSPQEGLKQLQNFPYQELGFAKVDTHRALRQGMPEVIFGSGKTSAQIIEIAKALKEHHSVVVATRTSGELAEQILPMLPGAIYDPVAQMIIWGNQQSNSTSNSIVAVVAAGTADLPVAEEAAVFLTASGVAVRRIYDVGVAGLHRLLANVQQLEDVEVTIVVAGMDGALPSVIGGLIECPIIAVPTSIGYGASFEGLSALLTMLNSCAAGLTVVNIDNGFGAAVAALRILSRVHA